MQTYSARNFPQASGSGAGAVASARSPMANANANARRGPGPILPPNASAISTQQLHAQQQAELQAQLKKNEDARNRSRRPVDRNLPQGLEDIVIGDGVQQYKRLREVERNLDAVMMRKRLELQDPTQRGQKSWGTMRVWISNTCENQPWQASGMDPHAFDFSSNVEATFKVKVEGRLVDANDEDEDNEVTGQNGESAENADEAGNGAEETEEPAAKRAKLSTPALPPRKKFSHFFKSIIVNFNRPQAFQPDGYTQIKWTRPDYQPSTQTDPPRDADFDCLTFERKADENINVTIELVPDEQPERYRLSEPLAVLLDLEEADRQTILMTLWEYIKSAGLLGDEEQRRFMLDDRLRAIFQIDSLSFAQLPDALRPFLFDPSPIVLPYTIRVDKAFHTSTPPAPPTIYEVSVPAPSPLLSRLRAMTASPKHTTALAAISQLDSRLALVVQALNHAKAKHAFFTSMSVDPAGFVQRWLGSQRRDLDTVLGTGPWGIGGPGVPGSGGYGAEDQNEWKGEEWRRGGGEGVWGSREAWEGVGSFLSRQKVL